MALAELCLSEHPSLLLRSLINPLNCSIHPPFFSSINSALLFFPIPFPPSRASDQLRPCPALDACQHFPPLNLSLSFIYFLKFQRFGCPGAVTQRQRADLGCLGGAGGGGGESFTAGGAVLCCGSVNLSSHLLGGLTTSVPSSQQDPCVRFPQFNRRKTAVKPCWCCRPALLNLPRSFHCIDVQGGIRLAAAHCPVFPRATSAY